MVKGAKAEWGPCSHITALNGCPFSLSCKNNTIAVGLDSCDIIMLDAITGSQTAILYGHTHSVRSLFFSSDGRLLASGSLDHTVKLWDVQTGGIIKTFSGHTNDFFRSVSISADCTRIASASNKKVYLWDIQTGDSHHSIEHQAGGTYVCFSPINPQHLIIISDDNVQEWNTDGYQTGPRYNGSCIAFSPDNTQFVLCNRNVVTVQASDSETILAEFQLPSDTYVQNCCFSPDGRLFAIASKKIAYVWNISNSSFLLIGTFSNHTDIIISLVFSSPLTLISVSLDGLVKFWQIDASSTAQATSDPKSTLPTSTSIEFVSLQAGEGIAISGDSDGVIKTWDLTTGLCKASFQTPATRAFWGDAQLIDGRLLFIWSYENNCHIWDSVGGEFPQVLGTVDLYGVRISGDKSKVFIVNSSTNKIQVWSVGTWELVNEMKIDIEREKWSKSWRLDPFCADGSKVWIQDHNLLTKGWDFGVPGFSPMSLPNDLSERPHLNFINGYMWGNGPSCFKDTVTGKEVFRLTGKYAHPMSTQWDGRYLVTGYGDGDILILDFKNLPL